MNKTCLYILFAMLFFSGSAYAQKQQEIKFNKYSVSLGMGIGLTNTPSFNDYVKNEIPFFNTDSVKNFSVGFEPFGGIEYNVNKNFSVKFDYSYHIKSVTYVYSYLTYDFFYGIHQPYLMAYYVARQTRYRFKFGAGAGYHFASLEKTISNTPAVNYNASGPSFRGEIIFSADLSNALESYISGFIGGSMLGSLKESNSNILKNPGTGEEVNLSAYGVGARLGFSIKF